MLRSIDFKTMPYLFTDKAGTCLTVEFDGRELDDIYKQVKAMHDQEHPSDGMPIEPMEPGWYMTRDGEDLLSFDGDAWHIHNLGGAEPFADGDLETMDWSVVKRTFDADSFPLRPRNTRRSHFGMRWPSPPKCSTTTAKNDATRRTRNEQGRDYRHAVQAGGEAVEESRELLG